MNWIKQNKFLTGFIAVMVIGVGVLGFLLVSAKSQYDEVTSNYEQQAGELHRLEGLQPFPSTNNLKQLDDQKKQYRAKVEELQRTLASLQIPLEPISPESFQDRARSANTAFANRAGQNGMKLPDKFYMGFDPYQTTPPRPEAAPLLGRELKAIELVLNQLADNRVAELRDLKRDELPEERGDKSKNEPAPSKNAKDKGKEDKGLVKKHVFEVAFLGDQNSIQKVLNGIVAEKSQLLIPRVVTIHNEKDKGPAKATANAPAPALGTDPSAAAAGAPATPVSQVIVGNEKVEVSMRIEIVDVANVPTGKTAVSAK